MVKEIELKLVNDPKVGNKYKLAWSYKKDALYKLLSWSNDGVCNMESKSGKRFQTHLKELRL